MSDDEARPVLIMTRRKGDEVAPTISDVLFEDRTAIVFLERPRKPVPADYAADGKLHPCIPVGEYDVDWTENVHPEHPYCYQIVTGPGTPAPDRSNILQHSANWIRELLGCQAPGMTAEVVQGQYEGKAVKELGVTQSVAALSVLLDKMQRRNYRLVIKEAA